MPSRAGRTKAKVEKTIDVGDSTCRFSSFLPAGLLDRPLGTEGAGTVVFIVKGEPLGAPFELSPKRESCVYGFTRASRAPCIPRRPTHLRACFCLHLALCAVVQRCRHRSRSYLSIETFGALTASTCRLTFAPSVTPMSVRSGRSTRRLRPSSCLRSSMNGHGIFAQSRYASQPIRVRWY